MAREGRTKPWKRKGFTPNANSGTWIKDTTWNGRWKPAPRRKDALQGKRRKNQTRMSPGRIPGGIFSRNGRKVREQARLLARISCRRRRRATLAYRKGNFFHPLAPPAGAKPKGPVRPHPGGSTRPIPRTPRAGGDSPGRLKPSRRPGLWTRLLPLPLQSGPPDPVPWAGRSPAGRIPHPPSWRFPGLRYKPP